MSRSSSSVPSSAPQAGVVTEKLCGDNFPLWRAQVIPPLRERQLVGFLDGKDQQVLGFLLSSLSRGVLTQVSALETTADVWAALTAMYSSQSRALVMQILESARDGHDHQDSHLLNFENRLDIHNGGPPGAAAGSFNYGGGPPGGGSGGGGISTVNLASRGGGRNGYRGGRGGGRGRGDGGRGGGGGNYNNSARHNSQRPFDANGNPRPQCQLCDKYGHSALKCWKRFNKDYNGEEKPAGSPAHAYGIDTNWYLDTGASNHVTGELEKLTIRDRYHAHEQIHTAGVAGRSARNRKLGFRKRGRICLGIRWIRRGIAAIRGSSVEIHREIAADRGSSVRGRSPT
ncbi:uncharacterized protein [Lolium perenne]|uniref:uncharacterized protein n=1 Tax=Lolium perenne TaxID=4522 RepID=UPI003A991B0A